MPLDELVEHVVGGVTLVLDVDGGHDLAHLQHGLEVHLLRNDLISEEAEELLLADLHQLGAAVVL